MTTRPYPTAPRERDRWILERRPERNVVDGWKPAGCFAEDERMESGKIALVATVLLTNRECPWRCLMCDLFRHTLTGDTPPGAIPSQIDRALAQLPGTTVIKLYNSGSFFDPRAIPPGDHEEIARRLRHFERVIVECHPALVNESAYKFRDRLSVPLEVAMGLETVHPDILPRLNKRMTLKLFASAAERLRAGVIALRAFVLLKPPFMEESAAIPWALRSVEFAFNCGATVVSLIPTRGGNGAMEALSASGDFVPPRLSTLEAALGASISMQRGRVFADLWDIERFSDCPRCFPARLARLREMNLTQCVSAPVECERCLNDV